MATPTARGAASSACSESAATASGSAGSVASSALATVDSRDITAPSGRGDGRSERRLNEKWRANSLMMAPQGFCGRTVTGAYKVSANDR